MEKCADSKRKRTETILSSVHLPKTLVGYGYLLDAAELIDRGAKIGPDLLREIAARNGKTYIQVRRGLQKAGQALLSCQEGEDSPKGDLVWKLLETMFSR